MIHLYSKAYYIMLYILFGLTQACAWPSEVAIMANWFGRGNRGLVLGFWASCQSVGNIVGSFLVPVFIPFGYEVCTFREHYAALQCQNNLTYDFWGLRAKPRWGLRPQTPVGLRPKPRRGLRPRPPRERGLGRSRNVV